MGILNEVMRHKILFVESRDTLKTSIEVFKYRKACDTGRGAVFLGVVRGKVSGKVRLGHHYGRCAIMFGVPL